MAAATSSESTEAFSSVETIEDEHGDLQVAMRADVAQRFRRPLRS